MSKLLNDINEILSNKKDTTSSYQDVIDKKVNDTIDDEEGSLEDNDETLEMVVSAIRNIASNANSILNNLNLERVKENLTEPWVFGIIAVLEDNMTSVHDFVKFSGSDVDTQTEGKSKPGLWENIRKKKEKQGKNYKPAKPGDKDRPDPDAWKKAQK